MKIKTKDLQLGDIVLQKVNDTEVCDKVVEVSNIPVYEPATFAIVDGFVITNGNRFGERFLKLNDDEVELIYRENPVKHISIEEELQNLKMEMKTMENNETNYAQGDYTASTVTNVTYNSQNDFNSLVEKYMLLDKKTLAELLALKEFQEQPQYPAYPIYPYLPSQGPWVTYCEKCTNPFHDCINCPHHTTGYPVEVTTNIKYTTNTTADIQ